MSVNGKYVRYWHHCTRFKCTDSTCHCHIVNSRKVIVRISECREIVRARAREMVWWGYLMVALHFRSFWNDSERRRPEKKCASILLGHFSYGAQHKRLAGGSFDDWKRMRARVGRGGEGGVCLCVELNLLPGKMRRRFSQTVTIVISSCMNFTLARHW